MGARQTITVIITFRKPDKKSLEHWTIAYQSSSKKKQPIFSQQCKVRSPSLYNIHQVPAARSWKYVVCDAVFIGPCHHGMARPQVADGGTASDMEGSCK